MVPSSCNKDQTGRYSRAHFEASFTANKLNDGTKLSHNNFATGDTKAAADEITKQVCTEDGFANHVEERLFPIINK